MVVGGVAVCVAGCVCSPCVFYVYRVPDSDGILLLAVGYGAVLFVLKGYIPTHPWWLLVIIYFIIGQGSNMTNCVAITTNVRNFKPSQKGTVVGTLKMNFGVRCCSCARS